MPSPFWVARLFFLENSGLVEWGDKTENQFILFDELSEHLVFCNLAHSREIYLIVVERDVDWYGSGLIEDPLILSC